MSFAPLSYSYDIAVPDAPQQWLPLIHLFDADLPLFPLLYFHVLDPHLTGRPGYKDRAYGYIRSVHFDLHNHMLVVNVICNQNLGSDAGNRFLCRVTEEVCNRIGAVDRVTLNDINALGLPHTGTNVGVIPVLREIWHRVVDRAYGGSLPFGRLHDRVFGLARFYASWNPPNGRKSELIQTHYFTTRFGEAIVSGDNLPHVDFYLLPTWEELTDITNPLSIFPKFSELADGAMHLCRTYPGFSARTFGAWSYTGFNMRKGVKLDRNEYEAMLQSQPHTFERAFIECFNAFAKGAPRTLIFLMCLNDIRQINSPSPTPAGTGTPRFDPARLTPSDAAALANQLGGYQSPKVISIYSQQCHGNPHVLPVDTWVGAFLEWPLAQVEYDPLKNVVKKDVKNKVRLVNFVSSCQQLGKVERLIWVTAQARKVHASACDDAVWCIKASRGANPLSCKACFSTIRNVCPAYDSIRNNPVAFNRTPAGGAGFEIKTSAGDETTPGQTFISCKGKSTFCRITDTETVSDNGILFQRSFPVAAHVPAANITVDQFVKTY